MRVISGMWRGRKLQAPPGLAVRPTTDRVKEALFNIIGPRLQNTWVIDLCCGTGSLGIEALSRGAARCIFVDQSKISLACTRGNLELCGAEPSTYELVRATGGPWLERWRPPSKGISWLMLADPPYQSDLTSSILTTLGALTQEAGFVMAVIEDDAATGLGQLRGLKTEIRRYGKSQLLFLTRETSGLEDQPID